MRVYIKKPIKKLKQ